VGPRPIPRRRIERTVDFEALALIGSMVHTSIYLPHRCFASTAIRLPLCNYIQNISYLHEKVNANIDFYIKTAVE
jgi:hypothetical protein